MPTLHVPKLIYAYDKDTFGPEDRLMLEDARPYLHGVKLGPQAIYASNNDGFRVADQVRDFVFQRLGLNVFWDFKLHETFRTVRATLANFRESGIEILTFHMGMSDNSLREIVRACKVMDTMSFAVSVLTDLSTKECEERYGSPPDTTLMYDARKAKRIDFDGIVCSVDQALLIKEDPELQDLKTLSPAIRPTWYTPKDDEDQVRIATPTEAAMAGVDYAVVGRPISTHTNPARAARLIVEEMTASARIT